MHPEPPAVSAIGRGGLASAAERWLRTIVEVPAAVVVVAEVLILFAGIIARAVFHSPLIWSDELASILFLWLAMLGAAIAVQRRAPHAADLLPRVLSPRARACAETLAVGALPAVPRRHHAARHRYVQDQAFVETPALGWSGVVRALAIPVGCGLALASCLLRLLRHDVRDVLAVAGRPRRARRAVLRFADRR